MFFNLLPEGAMTLSWMGIGKCIMIWYIARELYRNRKNSSFVLTVWKRISLVMVFETVILLFAEIAIGLEASKLVPFLWWKWTDLLNIGKVRILPILPCSDLRATSIENATIILVITSFVIAALPFFAHSEEVLFRKGCHTLKKICISSILFGLSHIIMGIPLFALISITLGGLFYGWKYKRTYNKKVSLGHRKKCAENEALMTCTAYHTLHNTIIVSLLLFRCMTFTTP